MHSDDGLKARIEEAEKDLLFYLRKYHAVSYTHLTLPTSDLV